MERSPFVNPHPVAFDVVESVKSLLYLDHEIILLSALKQKIPVVKQRFR
jgi:hypothetical protein